MSNDTLAVNKKDISYSPSLMSQIAIVLCEGTPSLLGRW